MTVSEANRILQRVHADPSALGPEAPFPLQEYQQRWRRTREMMADENIDLLYLTAPDSMCYMHGYRARWYRGHSPTVWAPVTGTAIHVNHEDPIHIDVQGEEVLVSASSVARNVHFVPASHSARERIEAVIQVLGGAGWLGGVVGMEHWSHVPNRAVSEFFEAAFLDAGCARVVDASRPVRGLRRAKSPLEVVCIERAAQICEKAHQAVVDTLRPGVTELEVYGAATEAMARAGGEISGIVGAVSSGPFLAGHALNSRRVIQPGDQVFYDPCGAYNRYHANLARGYFLGDPPRELVKLYALAGGAFDVLEQRGRAGAPVPEICRELRHYYEEVGIWGLREWVGGYELGIAFPPDWVGEFVWTVEEETEGTFQAGEVTNYESVLGTALIDTFVIEAAGARRLTHFPAELIVVG
jgi:Xaa-Pro dipeptidase